MAIAWYASGRHQHEIHTGLSLVTAAAVEPVLVSEFRNHARIDNEVEDGDLEGYLVASRQWCEAYTRRQFITATWRLTLDQFPCGSIEPPIAKLLTVSSVVYIATDGTSTTWDSSNYSVDAYSTPGRIEPVYNVTWPATRYQNNAVTVTFTAGYGATASTVPRSVRTAIKMLAEHLYEERSETSPIAIHSVPFGVKALLGCERWGSYV